MPDDDRSDARDESTSRRDVLKVTSAMTAAGAMGALAGCTGGDGGDGGGDGGDGGDGGGDGGDGGSTPTETSGGDGGDGGGGETVQITYLSAEAAENSLTGPQFEKSIGRFEDQYDGNVSVNLQTASYSDIRQQLSSRVSGGNPPTLAEFGGAGLEFFLNDQVPDHTPFVEGSDLYPDAWSTASEATANFRGTYWCGGPMRHSVSSLGIRPKMYSEAGVSDPMEELSTWTGFWEATQAVAEAYPDAFAYEKTGVAGDLEDYWGEARTAHTDGQDPWIRGEGANPELQIGNNPRTDGMIEHALALAQEFSSPEAAQRGDEEIPSLMLTDRVGSFTYATQNFTRWYQTKEDAVIGWDGGNGDFMLLPNPRVGSGSDLAEISGVDTLSEVDSGQHGGHVWALEQAHGMFSGFDQPQLDAAWALNTFFHRDEQHVLEQYGETYPSIPADTELQQTLLDEMGDDLPQNFTQVLQNLDEYGSQYNNTGAPWDVGGTDQIRWTDINETISQAIAGQIDGANLVSQVQSRVQTTLDEQNNIEM